MAIGNPINLTSNVEGKNISVIATAGQTQFTVTGGYRINQISVFRNGVRLVDGRDFTAADGATVTLLSAATVADVLEFQIFDDFRVSDALNVNSGGTVNGDVTVTGIVSTTNLSIGSSISLDATSGIVTAVQFIGQMTGTATTATNAEGLTGTPDITVNNIVAAAATFSGVLTYEDVTNVDSLGIVTARTGVDITANGLVVNAGVSTFGADLSIADKIIHSGDTNTAIRFPSNDKFTVETAGVQRLEVDSNGDLGLVGIATATGLVVVAGSGGYAGHTGIITAVTFDGALSGAATQVTVADESSDTSCFPLFVTAATGDLAPKSGTNLTFNSSTGALTATSFVGALTGAATQVTVADESSDTSCNVLFTTAATGDLAPKSGTNLTFNSSSGALTATSFVGASGDFEVSSSGAISVNRSSSSNDILAGKLSDTVTSNIKADGSATFKGDITIADKIIHDGDTNTAIRFPAADTFTVETGGSEALKIDSSQRVNIGGAAVSQTRTVNIGSNAEANLAIETHNDATSETANIRFYKSGNTAASPQIVEANDNIAQLIFYGHDGTDYANAAAVIKAAVDGTPGSNNMPGVITFSTNAGGTSVTERARIDSGGRFYVGGSTNVAHPNMDDIIVGDATGNRGITVASATNGFGTLAFGDSTDGSGVDRYQGFIEYYHDDDSMRLGTVASERARIDSGGRLLINTDDSRIVEDHVGNGPQGLIQIEATNSDAIMSIISAGTADANRCGTISLGRHRNSTVGGTPTIVQDGDALGAVMFSAGDGTDMRTAGAKIHAEVDGTPGSNDMPGALVFSTTPDGSSNPYNQERLRIDSRGSIQFSNGFMNETVKINSTARTGTQAVNLDDGMVHFFTSSSSGSWKPNFTMSSGNDINATIATGDTFSVTMIVAKSNTSHIATSAQVDGSDIGTIEFAGGTPTEGGGNNTFDVYHYTVIKTGDDTFFAFISITNYE